MGNCQCSELMEEADCAQSGLPSKLNGGVIVGVMSPEQAIIAEEAGASAVIALQRTPVDYRIVRMSDPQLINEVISAVSIPVIGCARPGHFLEAQILQQQGI